MINKWYKYIIFNILKVKIQLPLFVMNHVQIAPNRTFVTPIRIYVWTTLGLSQGLPPAALICHLIPVPRYDMVQCVLINFLTAFGEGPLIWT